VPSPDAVVIDANGVDSLITSLRAQGFRVMGPVVANGAIVHREIRAAEQLPVGWHDWQEPGSYRLSHGDDGEMFGWAVGPESFKQSVFPSRAVLWWARPDGQDRDVEAPVDDAAPEAFFGARPCEVAALKVLGGVLAGAASPDPVFTRRRGTAFVVTVECGRPAATCFCTSMGSGPGAEADFDLALTELAGPAGRFLVRVGSERGAAVLAGVASRPATAEDHRARDEVVGRAVAAISRTLDADAAPGLLARNLEHPRWDDVAGRCLACGNCTLVCPTCFCAAVEEKTDLAGTVEQTRRWDSCFDLAHSYLHGGSVRVSTRSRYRQWMTHKLSTWVDQFGNSGCVGCGRCITWCPAGIDITEECAAIAASDGAVKTNEPTAVRDR
jgi:ferredoxin